MVKWRVFHEFGQVDAVPAEFGDSGAVAAEVGAAVDAMGDTQQRAIVEDDRLHQDAVRAVPLSHAGKRKGPDIMDT